MPEKARNKRTQRAVYPLSFPKSLQVGMDRVTEEPLEVTGIGSLQDVRASCGPLNQSCHSTDVIYTVSYSQTVT